MMKIICILAFLLFGFESTQAQAPPSAEALLQAASQKALRENKNVFVIFHASWCVWCRRMDTAMSDPAIRPFFERNFVIEHLTVQESKGKEHLQHPGAEALLEKHGGKGQGIPFWLVFDPQGRLLASSMMASGSNSGCPATGAEVDHFIGVLKKTATLDDSALSAIRRRFSQFNN